MFNYSKEFKAAAWLAFSIFLLVIFIKGDLGFLKTGPLPAPVYEIKNTGTSFEENNPADKPDEIEKPKPGSVFEDAKPNGSLTAESKKAKEALSSDIGNDDKPAAGSVAGVKTPPEADKNKNKINEPGKEEAPQKEMHPVTLFVQSEKYETSVLPGSTAYELMLSLKNQGRLDFSGENYSGIGYFLKEINGVKNNIKTGEFWIYYINGKSASVGISGYVLAPGDVISWKYTKEI